MSSSQPRFTSQNETTQQRISSNTVGLVNLSDFRKRRAEVLEQQEREARDAINSASSAAPTPDGSSAATPDSTSDPAKRKSNKKKKLNKPGPVKLSFGDDDESEDAPDQAPRAKSKGDGASKKTPRNERLATNQEDEGVNHDGNDTGDADDDNDNRSSGDKKAKFQANASVSLVPRSMTKSALRREATERETLRQEFLARQEAVKNSEIAVPFVFYEGTNIPGGVVRVKKGDFIWVFLDKSRKVGANLGVGEKVNAMREWARVGVDDLMLVRGNVIIPPHYEFLYFIMNKTIGSNGRPLFGYSTDAPKTAQRSDSVPGAASSLTGGPLSKPSEAALGLPDIRTLEGASDDPSFTKVVDKRWYDRNKHIYPASMWQEFDPEKEVHSQVRRDLGGNTFFYS